MPQSETALGAAFNRAGYEDRESQLWNLALQMLEICDAAGCHRVLDRAARDKRGDDLLGQQSGENQRPYARRDEESQPTADDQRPYAPSSLSQHDGEQGQASPDNQELTARPVVPIPAAPSNLVPVMSHIRNRPFVHSRASRGASAIGAIQQIAAKVIVFRLSDDRDIMDVQFHELKKIEEQGAREMFVARYLRINCPYANPDPFMTVGELYPPKTLELAVAEANKGMADGAA